MRRALLVVVGLIVPAAAGAEEGFVRFDAGLLAGLGLGRFTAGYAPIRALAFEAGVGAGVVGTVLSAAAHGRLGNGRTQLLVGGGVALTMETSWNGDPNRGLWLDVDLGVEHVFASGLLLGAAVGVQQILLGCGSGLSGENPSDECDDSPFESGEFTTLELRLSIGYRF